ncbi:MAG: hypothetical protein ACRCVN_06895 [Spirochaetia bacterium]
MENKRTIQIIDRVVALKATMERELALIYEFNRSYDDVRITVQARDWNELQKLLKECGRISQDIVMVEQRRHQITEDLYATIELPTDRNFLEIVPYFPADLRNEVKKIYFALRAEVYRMRCRLKSLEVYARVRMELVRGVMDKAQAVQMTGNPYMRAGRRAMHDPDSFLFDSTK